MSMSLKRSHQRRLLFICSITLLILHEIEFVWSVRTNRADQIGTYIASKELGEGSWYGPSYCNEQSWSRGFDFKSQSKQNAGDDSAGNGISLRCEDAGGGSDELIATNSPKQKGSWDYEINCATGAWMTGFRSKVEGDQGALDDTGMNCIQVQCSNGAQLEPDNCRSWGSYGAWAYCPATTYMCGFTERYETTGEASDHTGLCGVRFYCCAFTAAPTNAPTQIPTTGVPTAISSPPTTAVPTGFTAGPSAVPSNQPTPVSAMPSSVPTLQPTTTTTAAPTNGNNGKGNGNGGNSNKNFISGGGSNSDDNTTLWLILGIVIGSVLCLILGLLFFYCWWKNRKLTINVNSTSERQIGVLQSASSNANVMDASHGFKQYGQQSMQDLDADAGRKQIQPSAAAAAAAPMANNNGYVQEEEPVEADGLGHLNVTMKAMEGGITASTGAGGTTNGDGFDSGDGYGPGAPGTGDADNDQIAFADEMKVDEDAQPQRQPAAYYNDDVGLDINLDEDEDQALNYINTGTGTGDGAAGGFSVAM